MGRFQKISKDLRRSPKASTFDLKKGADCDGAGDQARTPLYILMLKHFKIF